MASFNHSFTYGILFASFIVSMTIGVPQVYESVGDVQEAVDNHQEQLNTIVNSDIIPLNATCTNKTLNATFRNTGSTTLSVSETDLLINGSLKQNYTVSVEGNPADETWYPQKNLTVTYSNATKPTSARLISEGGVSASFPHACSDGSGTTTSSSSDSTSSSSSDSTITWNILDDWEDGDNTDSWWISKKFDFVTSTRVINESYTGGLCKSCDSDGAHLRYDTNSTAYKGVEFWFAWDRHKNSPVGEEEVVQINGTSGGRMIFITYDRNHNVIVYENGTSVNTQVTFSNWPDKYRIRIQNISYSKEKYRLILYDRGNTELYNQTHYFTDTSGYTYSEMKYIELKSGQHIHYFDNFSAAN